MKATVQSFLDQIDACSPETEFWRAITHNDSPTNLDGHPHRGEGGATTAVYQDGKLKGLTVLMRDEHNRTILVCIDLRETEREGL